MVRRLRSDAGANAVEFVLVFPILIMLLFGLIYGGLALNAQQQINHAAREASRFGATWAEPVFPDDAAFLAVATRASNTSAGMQGRSDSLLCVAYWTGADGDLHRRWYTLDTLATVSPDPPDSDCPNLINNDKAAPWVHVSILTPARVEAILVRFDVTLRANAVSVYEVVN